MTVTLYGIRNCDTVKRARAALDAAAIPFHFHDFRKDGLASETARSWLDTLGADTVINRRGTTWRSLSSADRDRAESEPASLLAEQPSLVKRPVFDRDGALRVGFPRADEAAILDWLRDA